MIGDVARVLSRGREPGCDDESAAAALVALLDGGVLHRGRPGWRAGIDIGDVAIELRKSRNQARGMFARPFLIATTLVLGGAS